MRIIIMYTLHFNKIILRITTIEINKYYDCCKHCCVIISNSCMLVITKNLTV